MFKPVSTLPYRIVTRKAQALLIRNNPDDLSVWEGRVAACLLDVDIYSIRDIIRDVLHNPQIRAIVFDGDCCCRKDFADFWVSSDVPDWKIDGEHLALVRQFVDLYDGDFWLQGPQQPFSPTRVMYFQ